MASYLRTLVVLAISLELAACPRGPAPEDASTAAVVEHEVIALPLDGPLSGASAEVSGMAWHGDDLILLPQYPDFPERGGAGAVYALSKADISASVASGGEQRLEPVPIPFDPARPDVEGFEGYEAIAFDGDRVFVTVETSPESGGMRGYVFAGQVAPDLASITIDTSTRAVVEPQSTVRNMSEEALLLVEGRVVTFYEANGAAVTPSPVAHVLDRDLQSLGTVPMAHVEYRVTDVTSVDADGQFWALNVFYPGDEELLPTSDPLAVEYGEGPTHLAYDQVERIIELRYSAEGITLVDGAPIQLQLVDAETNRNWEGLVRLDDRGFLVVTDRFPETILAFVAR